MKSSTTHQWFALPTLTVAVLLGGALSLRAIPAEVLYSDDFEGGIPGWTVAQSPGSYTDGPVLWQFVKVDNSFRENSNIYFDNATTGVSRRTAMLISEATVPDNFTYTARLAAGDDDGFGLVWGYQDYANFYRVSFARQNRAEWPHTGIMVDRMVDGVPEDLSGPHPGYVNTVAGRPFDVSIGVTNGLLTLRVVDDPLGAVGGPIPYDLIVDQPLPTMANGKVGLFTWGMQGPNSPAGFSVQSPALNGNPLDTEAINTVLTNGWSFTVTPSSSNDYPNDTGNWGFGVGLDGSLGMMIENNDSAPENTTATSTNTPVNAAVAGDVNWTNYILSARFVTPDDDGFGLLLRYQDRTNWYRIAFRRQNSQSGIKQGISVQKNVNRTFDQMLSSTAFIPPINAPFDVHAAVRNNLLQVMCVVDPDSPIPTITSFGPIDMGASALVPDNLPNGKVGVFSWAQRSAGSGGYGTGVDWLQVRKVNNEGLLISSTYGSPEPPVGLNDFPINGSITARVDNVVVTAPGIRQVSMGWSGGGSAPTFGSTNEVVFTLTQLSYVSWNWQTQYQLAAGATPGGSIVTSDGPWVNRAADVTLEAVTNPGYVFTGWSGDTRSTAPKLTLTMNRPYSVTANFAVDSDGDGLPDEWEFQFFGNLSQSGGADPDQDGKDNLTELLMGTNPTSREEVVLTDELSSRWINEARDRALPGWFVVTNFGPDFRGVWDTSDQYRYADAPGPDDFPFITQTSFGTNASFQGPAIVVRPDSWNPAWADNFSLSAECSVGDNDGICLYFRYQNLTNWYRVTLCGTDAPGLIRPFTGISVQKRVDGWFSLVETNLIQGEGVLGAVFPDPLDTSGFKKLRITVNGQGNDFEVRVIGWNSFLFPADWDPGFEVVLGFTDDSLSTGRIGIGSWAEGTFGNWNATESNPVGSGVLIDNINLQVNGTDVFTEDWESVPDHAQLPAGWENPYAGELYGLAGDWHVSAHGTLANFTRRYGSPQSGTVESPRADGEGPILLAPAITNASYVLALGIHPLDDGGMGFVYDFQGTNNYARVLFNSRAPGTGGMLQGVNVSRKVNGTWSDVLVGDNTFVYAPGRPFDVSFANNNGYCVLVASLTDDPAQVHRWSWADQPAAAGNRVGAAIWDMPDAHYTYFQVSSLVPSTPYETLKITSAALVSGNIVLGIQKPAGATYHLLSAPNVLGPYSTNALNQTGAEYIEPAPTGNRFYRLQLVP
ncbi:MAG: hypothetical protein M9920_10700 [Verrucomicrobiae bacterium]|nr:hypothetical protein [Verrucomicrobiae bacterium]